MEEKPGFLTKSLPTQTALPGDKNLLVNQVAHAGGFVGFFTL